MSIRDICSAARHAAARIAIADTKKKNRLLRRMADRLERDERKICRANARDLAGAGRLGLTNAMKDRLFIDKKRLKAMARSIHEVMRLADPVGRVLKRWRRPNGMWIEKVSVPLGVILIIYESRPNVTADCASLCIKSGNAVILRGGREARHSNGAIVTSLKSALSKERLPEGAIGFIEQKGHTAVSRLLKESALIDLVIPRGGEALIRKVAEESRIPVIKHYRGNCHVYIDQNVDSKMAVDIPYNAKTQRPGVCNAMETLLVHRAVARRILPKLAQRFSQAGVELRGCPKTRRILSGIRRATEQDWYEEFLDRVLAVRVVNSLEDAIKHIAHYGSQHSDAIVTRSKTNAERFVREVDSSSVFVNVSTRLADGGIYGFGSEIGISTDKLHARGPMGIEDLTTYKYVVRGTGQIRK